MLVQALQLQGSTEIMKIMHSSQFSFSWHFKPGTWWQYNKII